MKKSKSITTTNTTSVQLLNGTRLNMANALHCQIGLNPNSLLGDSFLSRGDGGILVGQSAVGKSTFALQMACYLAIGKDFFGLKSTFGKPLKVLLVQSENGAEEVTEVLQSITQHWSAKEKQQLESQLAVEIIWDSRGADFGKWLRNILPEHNPDLVIVDPLMSYLGADVLSNEAITKFLRENINKVLKNPPVGCQSFGLLFVHHTGKPNSNGKKEEKPTRERGWIHQLHAFVIPSQQIGRGVLEFAAPFRHQGPHFVQNFQRGIASDAPAGHGQQTAISLTPPADAGKDHVGIKHDPQRMVELLFGWTKHSRQEMSEKKPNMFGFIPGMGRKLQ